MFISIEKTKRILIVDDDGSIRELLRAVLRLCGYTVETDCDEL